MGPLVEHQVVVGLHGIGLDCSPPDPDEPAVDRMRCIGHGSHEQEVARRARGTVVLKGAEVEHLIVSADEGGPQGAGTRVPHQSRVGPQPGVAATEGHGIAGQRCVGTDRARLMGELPGGPPERLDGDIGEGCTVVDLQLGHRHNETLGGNGCTRGPVGAPVGAPVGQQSSVGIDDDLDHPCDGTGPSPNHGAGEHGCA